MSLGCLVEHTVIGNVYLFIQDKKLYTKNSILRVEFFVRHEKVNVVKHSVFHNIFADSQISPPLGGPRRACRTGTL